MGMRDTLRRARDLIVEPPEDSKLSDHKHNTEGSPSPSREPDLLRTDNRRVREQPDKPAAQGEGRAGTDDAKRPATAQTLVPDLSVDFAGIYHQANLPIAPFTAEEIVRMLSELPAELPLDTKRRTVKVALNTMGKSVGATPETIVADAYRKRTVLAAYVESVSRQAEKFVVSTEEQIANLRVEIEEKRIAIQTAQNKQVRAVQVCQAESKKLADVLEFFSDVVSPSSYSGHHTDKE